MKTNWFQRIVVALLVALWIYVYLFFNSLDLIAVLLLSGLLSNLLYAAAAGSFLAHNFKQTPWIWLILSTIIGYCIQYVAGTLLLPGRQFADKVAQNTNSAIQVTQSSEDTPGGVVGSLAMTLAFMFIVQLIVFYLTKHRIKATQS